LKANFASTKVITPSKNNNRLFSSDSGVGFVITQIEAWAKPNPNHKGVTTMGVFAIYPLSP